MIKLFVKCESHYVEVLHLKWSWISKCLLLLALLHVNGFWSTAQTITGKVSNAEGESLVGDTVKLKGTETGSTTDNEGKYSIVVLGGRGVLIFTYVGYQMKEVAITDKKSVNVVMEKDAGNLTDVVVVGYGSQKKANLTGAVDQIGAEFFKDRPVPNITRAIQGAVPNLNIRISDGRPVANPGFNIRGATSIGAGGDALILIDGVPSDPLNVNPNDIESVTVLKDAASAAIYGARAAFGVVLITTKSPKKEKTRVSYSANYSINQRTKTQT